MSEVEEILDLLKDGGWRNLDDIAAKIRLSNFKIEKVANFLAKYNFIYLDKERRRVKLTPTMLNFLRNTQQIEEEATRPFWVARSHR